MAHALREHAREQVSHQMAANIGLSILAAVTGSQATAHLGSQLNKVMFALPNSRTDETEADQIGVELAARAGYDPRAAVTDRKSTRLKSRHYCAPRMPSSA